MVRDRDDESSPTRRLRVPSDRSFGSAVKWSALMTGGRQAANLVITFILAALLGPTAFGLVAIALVYVAFIQMLMQQGMGAALIQRRDLTDDHLASAFWVIMISASGLSVLALAASDWWAGVNDQPELGPLVRSLTPLLFLRGLLVVPEAVLRRDLAFRPLAVRTNVSVIGGGVIGVLAAFAGAGVWALVAQQLTTALLEVVIVWRAVSWRPTLSLSRDAIADLFSFSWRSAVASLGVFVNDRADAMIIGLTLGPTTVGLYRFAARLVETVLQSISGTLREVALPELSRLQAEPEAVTSRVLSLQRIAATAAFVPLAALAAAGPALVNMLGDEWNAATAAVAILAIAGAGRVAALSAGPLLIALGYPGRLAVLTWVAAIMSGLALFVGSTALRDQSSAAQVTGLAILAAILHTGVFFPISSAVTSRLARVSWRRLLACLVPGTVAGVVGFVFGRLVDSLASELDAPLLRVVLTGGSALVVAAAVVALIEPEIRNRLRSVTWSHSRTDATRGESRRKIWSMNEGEDR